MKKCPTCGSMIPDTANDNPEQLLQILKTGVPHREVYRSREGTWHVTYQRGEWTERAIKALVAVKCVRPVSTLGDDSFHVGRTMDHDRTMIARRKGSSEIIYTDEIAS